MRSCFALFALLVALAAPAYAQVQDSITVEVVGEPAAILVDGPIRAYLNTDVVFRFQIVDAEGQPSVGIAVWESTDESKAQIISETDSTVTVRMVGRGRVVLRVYVERLVSLAIGGTYGEGTGESQGRFHWASEGSFTLQCEWEASTGDPCGNGPRAHLCVLGRGDNGNLWASNEDCATQALSGDVPLRQALGEPDWHRSIRNVTIVAAGAFKGLDFPAEVIVPGRVSGDA